MSQADSKMSKAPGLEAGQHSHITTEYKEGEEEENGRDNRRYIACSGYTPTWPLPVGCCNIPIANASAFELYNEYCP